MLLLEIYLDRIVDEGQRSRKTKPAAGVWEGQEAADGQSERLQRAEHRHGAGVTGVPLIAGLLEPGSVLRWGKEKARRPQGLRDLKGILQPMDVEAEPRIIHFPWIRHENRVSLAIVEQMSLCSGNVIDAALQRTKALVRGRGGPISSPTWQSDQEGGREGLAAIADSRVLEDKSNHAILQLLMDSAEKCSHRSRADLLCALGILWRSSPRVETARPRFPPPALHLVRPRPQVCCGPP